jgi:hypothetical protein
MVPGSTVSLTDIGSGRSSDLPGGPSSIQPKHCGDYERDDDCLMVSPRIKNLHGGLKLDIQDEIRIIHQLKPIAKRLAPTLYVVGENAMLNWNAKKDHGVQTRCHGGEGSKSLLDQLLNNPASSSVSFLSIRIASTRVRGLEKICLTRVARCRMVVISIDSTLSASPQRGVL